MTTTVSTCTIPSINIVAPNGSGSFVLQDNCPTLIGRCYGDFTYTHTSVAPDYVLVFDFAGGTFPVTMTYAVVDGVVSIVSVVYDSSDLLNMSVSWIIGGDFITVQYNYSGYNYNYQIVFTSTNGTYITSMSIVATAMLLPITTTVTSATTTTSIATVTIGNNIRNNNNVRNNVRNNNNNNVRNNNTLTIF